MSTEQFRGDYQDMYYSEKKIQFQQRQTNFKSDRSLVWVKNGQRWEKSKSQLGLGFKGVRVS